MKIIRLHSKLIFYIYVIINFNLHKRRKRLNLAKKIIVFDIRSEIWNKGYGRQFYLLAKSFLSEGYFVIIISRYQSIIKIYKQKYRHLIIFEQNIAFGKIPRKMKNFILIHDNCQNDDRAYKNLKVIYDFDYLKKESSIILPYFMHPKIQKDIDIVSIELLRKNTKKRKIFFAGNINKKDYESDSLAIIHKKISRPNIIKFIYNNFDINKNLILNDLNHSNEYSNKIHIIDTNFTRIPIENWLNVLSESHFFLACPGVRSPVCHNIVEAMAVGVIPILEYPEYFFPPLEDMSNCIVFKDERGLIKAIKKALELPIEEIKIISKNAMKYYDNHLKQNNFIKDIEKANIKDLQLVAPMLCPHETVKIISSRN